MNIDPQAIAEPSTTAQPVESKGSAEAKDSASAKENKAPAKAAQEAENRPRDGEAVNEDDPEADIDSDEEAALREAGL